MEFKKYVKNGIAEMRPYIEGEDLTGVSVGEHIPSEGGMIARDPNNYDDQWYVPREFFEENYSVLNHDFMTFGEAVNYLKIGLKVARKGWNGKGMYITLKPGYPDGVSCNQATANSHGIEEGSTIKYLPYLEMKTVDGSFVPWLASQTDVLAEDWEIV